MTNYYESVLEVLKQEERFFSTGGTLLRNTVYEAAMQMDVTLLHLLLSNEDTKKAFFTDVDGILVFDKVKFGWVINTRQFLPDSYTRFKNKIGLADENGELLSASGKVELIFPYKDCVLEGGQTKEDQKRSEIFYNETLAPGEIDRLLYPKVLVNAKRYTYDGEIDLIGNPTGDASFSCNLTTEFLGTDNLIIKGNNLLVLSSLLKRYEGKIKCIYIDPPYYFTDNKSGDTFGYNSNFKLSTWLAFMKDRLVLSRRLLCKRKHMDTSAKMGTLKLLTDDIFGVECFVSDVQWQKTYSPRNDSKGVSSEVESILVYSKQPGWQPQKLERTEKMNSVYKNPDNDYSLWRTSDAFAPSAATHQGMVYAIQHPFTGEYLYPYDGACWPLKQDSMLEEMRKWAKYKLELIDDVKKRSLICGVPIAEDKRDVKAIVLDESLEESKKKVEAIYKRGQWPKFFFTSNGRGGIARKTYLDDAKGKVVTNFWPFDEAGHTDEAKKEIVALFGNKAFGTPKPERLIERILKIATDENDLVLDYFIGSGTTLSVAHKMKRHYIGVDQMDYIDDVAVERLKKVICGEQGGISQSVGWQGGGSFVYCELAKLNQAFVDEIQVATDADTIKDIYNRILSTGFISCKVNPADIDAAAGDFGTLSLDDQKCFLMELLDKNLLYVNLCDIDDEEFDIGKEDKAFTKSFYKEV